MNVAVKAKPQTTDLAVIETISAAVVFVPGGVDSILKKITDEVRSVATDISTPQGRAAIASLAYKVARSKTALDEMGKDLVAELKAKTGAIDAERRTIRDRLDALKDEVRQPLTDWENAEKARVEAHETAIAAIQALSVFDAPEPALPEIEQRILSLEGMSKREWQEFGKRAADATGATLTSLTSLRDRTIKREAERVELERLRREQIEREQRERDAAIAAQAAEKARLEAEAKAKIEAEEAAARAEAERQRVEHEKAEAIARAERAEAEKKAAAAKAEADRKAAAEAAEKARHEAEAKAKRDAEEAAAKAEAEHQRVEKEKADAIARAEKAEADKKAAAAKAEADRKAAAEAAERDRLASIEAERKRVADAKAAEDAETAKREADKAHRAKINKEALAALVASGLDEATAKIAITAIAQGKVPHTRISY